jgi:hypothetical protein
MSSDQEERMKPQEGNISETARPVDKTRVDGNVTDSSFEMDESVGKSFAARPDREKTFARRALLHAGWTAPIIVGLVRPPKAFAIMSQPIYENNPYIDTPHVDIQPFNDHRNHHTDIRPHGDMPHGDQPYGDLYIPPPR